jgi:ABC-2 type transport system ATP-binding protein
VLSVVDLKKRFGSRVAVDGVSFAIRAGETVGLLGPNGAGKTTTLGIINGLVTPDSGSIYFKQQLISAGSDALKRSIGLVPQDLALYDELSAWANLQLFGGLFGLSNALLAERAAAALDLVGLADRKRDRVKGFSGGMKRRLNIACALLHDPELILLDEPTVGVDPQSRNAIFENLEELKRRGKTLLYTTHYMEEAERLCDRIVIVDGGRVIADDTVHGLYQRLPPSTEVMIELEGGSPTEELLRHIAALPGIAAARATVTGMRLETSDFGATLSQALAHLASQHCKVRAVQSVQPNLERVFIALTGHALRDNAPAGEPS